MAHAPPVDAAASDEPAWAAGLGLALADAADTLQHCSQALAAALTELGDIDLPDGAPTRDDARTLGPLGPFYLARELDQAGVLRAAEQVAGLYGSGAITQPVGAAGPLLRRYWQERRNRLTEAERGELFERVFEAPHFDRMLAALMRDLAAHADNGPVEDLREAVALEVSARALAEFLLTRAGGMTLFAATEIVASITEALAFLREPALHAAFSVRGLWPLVALASGDATGGSTRSLQDHVDRARNGQTVLGWLARATAAGQHRLDLRAPDTAGVIAAAERWLLAAPAAAPPPTLPGAGRRRSLVAG